MFIYLAIASIRLPYDASSYSETIGVNKLVSCAGIVNSYRRSLRIGLFQRSPTSHWCERRFPLTVRVRVPLLIVVSALPLGPSMLFPLHERNFCTPFGRILGPFGMTCKGTTVKAAAADSSNFLNTRKSEVHQRSIGRSMTNETVR